jgi:hypothetical protein
VLGSIYGFLQGAWPFGLADSALDQPDGKDMVAIIEEARSGLALRS